MRTGVTNRNGPGAAGGYFHLPEAVQNPFPRINEGWGDLSLILQPYIGITPRGASAEEMHS